MTKQELTDFLKRIYCDIEAVSLPKIVGSLPVKERLLTETQLAIVLAEAERHFGTGFAEFLENNLAKGTVPAGTRKRCVFWIDFDNWDFLYECWRARESGRFPR